MNKLRYPDENKPDRMGVTMKDMLALGRVKKADTLDEMAKLINVPADHLKATVAEYNKAASNKGTKDKFGFVATNTDDAPMTEGPWYACLKVRPFTTRWAVSASIRLPELWIKTVNLFPDFMQPGKSQAEFTALTA